MLRETYRCAAVLLAAAAVLAGCGGSDEDSGLAKPFAYESSQPLDFHSRTTPLGGQGVEVRDISFAGPGGTELDGYLASPSSSGAAQSNLPDSSSTYPSSEAIAA